MTSFAAVTSFKRATGDSYLRMELTDDIRAVQYT